MIELIIKEYLDNNLTTPVYLEKTNIVPEEFIVFEKVGSGKKNHLNISTIAFQSYAKSMYNAVLLNNKVKECVESLTECNEICKVRLNNDYNFTDTSTKSYRYQAIFDIYHY